MMPLTAADMAGGGLESVKGIYLPAVLAGINASSPNRETAEEFIRTLLGKEVQDESLRDGFAVRSGSLDSWAETEKDLSSSMSMNGLDLVLSGAWPAKPQREELLALVRTADTPAMPDPQLLKLIYSGAVDYLDGKESKEQAVQKIESKMQIYLSEQE